MADVGATAEPQPLLADAEGALPKPWVAHRKPDPPHQGSLYYCNLATMETRWERPQVRIARHCVYQTGGIPLFEPWRDLHLLELPAANAAEATETFRDFCVRLFPGGTFGRRRDGVLWRLGKAEHVGVMLYPGLQRLAVAYNSEAVPPEELAAVAIGGAAGARLSPAAKISALVVVQRSLAARLTAAATLAAPEAHSLRRYAAELAGEGSSSSTTSRPLGRVVPGVATALAGQGKEATQLAAYLLSFGLLRPLSCGLTGVGYFQDEVELAAHLQSEHHRQRRVHLRTAVELLAEVRQGEVPLSDWLPSHAAKYKSLLQWRDRRFQDMPTVDGRVLRFDHLSGRGCVMPASSATSRRPPPALASHAEDARWGAAGPGEELPPLPSKGCAIDGHFWSAATDATVPPTSSPSGGMSVEELLWAVGCSLGEPGERAAAAPEPMPGGQAADEEDLEVVGPWSALRDHASGRQYYYNSETKETTWERPLLVEVGETWNTHRGTCACDTVAELYQRYHRMVPRPQRLAP
mmetsp:Transcript_74645/g.205809  ORF Transcript_74645/g.205809 Transcript_74645/m.205809 type:complete len:522 (-) Transcript_74645:126-1691(-)